MDLINPVHIVLLGISVADVTPNHFMLQNIAVHSRKSIISQYVMREFKGGLGAAAQLWMERGACLAPRFALYID
jgi:hypothetical protein